MQSRMNLIQQLIFVWAAHPSIKEDFVGIKKENKNHAFSFSSELQRPPNARNFWLKYLNFRFHFNSLETQYYHYHEYHIATTTE